MPPPPPSGPSMSGGRPGPFPCTAVPRHPPALTRCRLPYPPARALRRLRNKALVHPEQGSGGCSPPGSAGHAAHPYVHTRVHTLSSPGTPWIRTHSRSCTHALAPLHHALLHAQSLLQCCTGAHRRMHARVFTHSLLHTQGHSHAPAPSHTSVPPGACARLCPHARSAPVLVHPSLHARAHSGHVTWWRGLSPGRCGGCVRSLAHAWGRRHRLSPVPRGSVCALRPARHQQSYLSFSLVQAPSGVSPLLKVTSGFLTLGFPFNPSASPPAFPHKPPLPLLISSPLTCPNSLSDSFPASPFSCILPQLLFSVLSPSPPAWLARGSFCVLPPQWVQILRVRLAPAPGAPPSRRASACGAGLDGWGDLGGKSDPSVWG